MSERSYHGATSRSQLERKSNAANTKCLKNQKTPYLLLEYVEHPLQGQLLEVEAVALVKVRTHGLRVVVYDNLRSEQTHVRWVLFNNAPNTFYLVIWCQTYGKLSERERGRKEMFYLMTHPIHFIYGYMASDIW